MLVAVHTCPVPPPCSARIVSLPQLGLPRAGLLILPTVCGKDPAQSLSGDSDIVEQVIFCGKALKKEAFFVFYNPLTSLQTYTLVPCILVFSVLHECSGLPEAALGGSCSC